MFIGFACSIGLMGGINGQNHHQESAKKSTHKHSHEHGEVGKSHHHDKVKPHNHKTDHKGANDKKECCSDEVQKIQQLDKNINSKAKIISNEIITNVPQTHYQSYTLIFASANPAKLRERFFFPPPPNILLSIQRFQI